MQFFSRIFLLSIFLNALLTVYCQAQDAFKFNYRFRPSMNPKGDIIEEIPGPGGTKPSYRLLDATTMIKMGKIKISEGHDSLKLSPWYYTGAGAAPNVLRLTTVPNTAYPVTETNTYSFLIDWTSAATLHHGYRFFDVPFRYSQFAITSLPFRIDFRTGEFKNEFLNANISYLFISGKTRFYKSKFLSTRNTYWGWGPFIGASTVEDDEKKNHFGFNYGLNGVRSIRNINLTLAIGAESCFTSKANDFTPYVGIGLGIKLIELF